MNVSRVVGFYVSGPDGRKDFDSLSEAKALWDSDSTQLVLGRVLEAPPREVMGLDGPIAISRSRHGDVIEDRR